MNEEQFDQMMHVMYAIYITQRRCLDTLYAIAGSQDEKDAQDLIDLHEQGKLWGPETVLTFDEDDSA